MARITSAVIPLINAADALTEQARDLLQLHRHEVQRHYSGGTATLEAALEALNDARDQMERS